MGGGGVLNRRGEGGGLGGVPDWSCVVVVELVLLVFELVKLAIVVSSFCRLVGLVY